MVSIPELRQPGVDQDLSFFIYNEYKQIFTFKWSKKECLVRKIKIRLKSK